MAECNVSIPHAASGVVTEADDTIREYAATREFYRWMVDVTDCLQRANDEMMVMQQEIDDLRAELVDAGVLP